jgi:acyl-CoA synthetase (AMP-forming)/AMP-acid ligase II
MLNELFDKAAQTHSDAIAIVYDDRRISFFELQLYVDWMAGYFQSIALRPGERVALLIPNSPELVISFFGLMHAGGVAVPLDVFANEQELQETLRISKAGAVITTPACKTQLDKALAGFNYGGEALPRLAIAIFEEDNIVTLNHVVAAKNCKASPSNHDSNGFKLLPSSNGGSPAGEAEKIVVDPPAVVQLAAKHEGGKLSVRTHSDLKREAEAMIAQLELTSADRVLCMAPLSPQNRFGNCLVAAISAGAAMVLPQPGDWSGILQALAEERVTVLAGPISLLAHLMETNHEQLPRNNSLRGYLCTGAPLSPEMSERLHEKIGFQVFSAGG